jgi:hypothetical protein
MSVLIDTSVCDVDHFRNNNTALVEIIGLDFALIHPMVLGKIACGTPPAPRAQTLTNLGLLRQCKQARMKSWRLSSVENYTDSGVAWWISHYSQPP